MMNDISRRLLIKLIGATGATLAIPPAAHAALPEPERFPAFEYFDGNKWIELGGVFDANVKVTVEQIDQGFGRPPMRGVVTAETTVDYYRCTNDPFADPNCPRVDIRIMMEGLGNRYRFECARAMPVDYSINSAGKVRVVLLSGGYPEMSLA